ncbi:death-on-curing protein [Nocardia sp. GAS34]|uniref:type II toxin-antitoxin system death-on-curing family toxin n=1 Tax=unclassified Nocardia TaxID=2637762 RepID=UPI003D1E4146
MQYLTLQELLNLAKRLGTDEVRDYGLLDSALARPQSSVFGQDAYPDVWTKAAALMESLALNGHPLDADFNVDTAEQFVLGVCQGMHDVTTTAEHLRQFAAEEL